MMVRRRDAALALAFAALLAVGCSNKHVSRIEPDTVTDLSGA